MLPFQGGGLGAARGVEGAVGGAQGAALGMMIYCPFRAMLPRCCRSWFDISGCCLWDDDILPFQGDIPRCCLRVDDMLPLRDEEKFPLSSG